MYTITPRTAILICLNAMIGAGLFINPAPLTLVGGPLGFLGYAVAAILLFPLVLSVAALAQHHPVAGGLYVYNKQYLGTTAGFISGWGYFVGKTATLALLANRFVLFVHRSYGLQAQADTVFWHSCLLLAALCLLHLLGMHIGGKIQYGFSTLKLIPLTTACALGLVYLRPQNFTADLPSLKSLFSLLPIAVFPLLGFEIICSVGHLIQDSANNIRLVIVRAFVLVATLNTIFQFLLFGTFGTMLATSNEPLRLFSYLSHPLLGPVINTMVFIAILGTCFAIMSSNCWNLHALAKDRLLPGWHLITAINQHQVPWVSVIIECMVACIILAIAQDQVALQNMSVFAQICSLLLCMGAAFVAARQQPHIFAVRPQTAAAGACAALGVMCIALHKLLSSGVCLPFVIILAMGGVLGIAQRIWIRFAAR